jgi:hypothetical protein
VGPFSPGVAVAHGAHERGAHHGGRGIPRDRLGLQQWSIRDAITRLEGSVSGSLRWTKISASYMPSLAAGHHDDHRRQARS